MLVETDAPYLAPVPFRGKINQPAYVRHVAEEIACLRGITYDAVAAITTDNFSDCFPWPDQVPPYENQEYFAVLLALLFPILALAGAYEDLEEALIRSNSAGCRDRSGAENSETFVLS